MSRTILPPQRLKEIKEQYIGFALIFCEGSTEYNYMNYFAEIINKKDNKYANIVVNIELEVAGGNARKVLNYSEKFLEDNNKYQNYKKYLVFDCDAPHNIQEVIRNACDSNNEYELLVSNFIFENWLLMHFEDTDEDLSKSKTYRRLEQHLMLKRKEYSKKKNNKGIIRQIIYTGNVDNAIKYAKKIDNNYIDKDMTIYTSINEMKPYSNVYKLIEQFLLEISDNF